MQTTTDPLAAPLHKALPIPARERPGGTSAPRATDAQWMLAAADSILAAFPDEDGDPTEDGTDGIAATYHVGCLDYERELDGTVEQWMRTDILDHRGGDIIDGTAPGMMVSAGDTEAREALNERAQADYSADPYDWTEVDGRRHYLSECHVGTVVDGFRISGRGTVLPRVEWLRVDLLSIARQDRANRENGRKARPAARKVQGTTLTGTERSRLSRARSKVSKAHPEWSAERVEQEALAVAFPQRVEDRAAAERAIAGKAGLQAEYSD